MQITHRVWKSDTLPTEHSCGMEVKKSRVKGRTASPDQNVLCSDQQKA